jgi:hypothetical protein
MVKLVVHMPMKRSHRSVPKHNATGDLNSCLFSNLYEIYVRNLVAVVSLYLRSCLVPISEIRCLCSASSTLLCCFQFVEGNTSSLKRSSVFYCIVCAVKHLYRSAEEIAPPIRHAFLVAFRYTHLVTAR